MIMKETNTHFAMGMGDRYSQILHLSVVLYLEQMSHSYPKTVPFPHLTIMWHTSFKIVKESTLVTFDFRSLWTSSRCFRSDGTVGCRMLWPCQLLMAGCSQQLHLPTGKYQISGWQIARLLTSTEC